MTMARKQKDIRLHAVEILGGLDRLRASGILCDIILVVESQEIPAHRNVLAARSDYFAAMFTSNMEETRTPKVSLHDVAYDGVSAVINHIYTGKFEVEEAAVLQEVIVVTDLFRMDGLKQIAVDRLKGYLNDRNCIGLWFFADMYSCKDLHSICQDIIRKRFVSLTTFSDEFVELEEAALSQLLEIKRLSLGPDGEDTMVSAILRWIDHDPPHRAKALPHLLHSVHVSCISTASVGKLQQHLNTDDFEAMDQRRTEKHTIESPLDSIYLIGGYLQSRTGTLSPRLTQIHRYDLTSNSWSQPSGSLPDVASLLFAFTSHGRLLCLIRYGHFDLLEYNIVTEKWTVLDKNVVLSQAAIKALALYFVPVGGDQVYNEYTDELFLATAQKVVSIKLKECDLDSLKFDSVRDHAMVPNDVEGSERQDFTFIMHQQILFSLGGSRFFSASQVEGTSDVYSYDPASDSWIEKSCMLEHRAKLSAASLGDFIYVMGGFGTRRLSSAERYCSKTNQWTVLSGMRKQRTHAIAIAARGHIYIFGGKSYADNYQCGGARKVIKSSERYDPETDIWEEIVPMPVSRCQYAAIAY